MVIPALPYSLGGGVQLVCLHQRNPPHHIPRVYLLMGHAQAFRAHLETASHLDFLGLKLRSSDAFVSEARLPFCFLCDWRDAFPRVSDKAGNLNSVMPNAGQAWGLGH